MNAFEPLRRWPVYRQLTGADPLGRGRAATSRRTESLRPRTASADRVVKSVCPYCAVGCGQQIYVKDDRVVQIEGDPDSPIAGAGCAPKGRRRSSSPPARSAATGSCTGARTAGSGSRSTWRRRWTWSPTG
ncbi:hypothetical protein SCHAM137S_05181 [Streptomyces chartreusis]